MEEIHTAEWAESVHKSVVWFCDDESHPYCEFPHSKNLQHHFQSDHEGTYTPERIDLKLFQNNMNVPRAQNICPLCNQDILALFEQAGMSATAADKRKRNIGDMSKITSQFQGADQESNSDSDFSSASLTSKRFREVGAVNRERISRHIGSHLKSLAFLSIRYLEEDESSETFEKTSFGDIPDDGDEHRLDGDFPGSEGIPTFEDIPPDMRSNEHQEMSF